jgi:hypothetical protein
LGGPAESEDNGVVQSLPTMPGAGAPHRVVAGAGKGDGLGIEVQVETATDEQAQGGGCVVGVPSGPRVACWMEAPFDLDVIGDAGVVAPDKAPDEPPPVVSAVGFGIPDVRGA